MSRPRGNKTSNAAREQRRSSVAEVLQENPSIVQADLAEVTGVSLATVKRDLAELRDRFSLITDERYEEFKRAQLAVFELIERNLIEGSVTPEVAREWRGIRSEISQLLGLNAPSKSIHATINANHISIVPSQISGDRSQDDSFWELRIRKSLSGLSEAQFYRVIEFASRTVRESVARTPLLEGEVNESLD